VKQIVIAKSFHAPSHPGVLKTNGNMNGNILQTCFTHKKIIGVPIILANVFWRKYNYFIMWVSLHFQLFLLQWMV